MLYRHGVSSVQLQSVVSPDCEPISVHIAKSADQNDKKKQKNNNNNNNNKRSAF